MTRPSLRRFGRSQGRLTVVKMVAGEIHVRFGQIDTDDLVEYMQDLGLRMEDLQPVFDRYGEYLVDEHILMQFRRQGFPKRWAALSPAYARWKARHYPGKPILEATGRMRRGFRWEARPRSLRVINRVRAGQQRGSQPRWFYHQSGTDVMPARKMLQITDDDHEQLQEFAREHLEGAQSE